MIRKIYLISLKMSIMYSFYPNDINYLSMVPAVSSSLSLALKFLIFRDFLAKSFEKTVEILAAVTRLGLGQCV